MRSPAAIFVTALLATKALSATAYPISLSCADVQNQLQQYSTLLSICRKEIEHQEELVPLLQANALTCRARSGNKYDACMAWNQAFVSHIYRLLYAIAQEEWFEKAVVALDEFRGKVCGDNDEKERSWEWWKTVKAWFGKALKRAADDEQNWPWWPPQDRGREGEEEHDEL